jgi:hypothetical protein
MWNYSMSKTGKNGRVYETSVVEEGRIVSKDFASLLATIFCGLWIGYTKPEKRAGHNQIGTSRTDHSYVAYVGYLIDKLTDLKPFVSRYPASKPGFKERSILQTYVKKQHLEVFEKLRMLREDFSIMHKLLLRSELKIQKEFLRTVVDAKTTPNPGDVYGGLDFSFSVNSEQLPILTDLLDSIGIYFIPAVEEKPKNVWIRREGDVKKLLQLGIRSEELKSKIRELTGDLYERYLGNHFPSIS